MRFVTFTAGASGGPRMGALDGDKVVELAGVPPGVTGLRGLLGALGPGGLAGVTLSATAPPLDLAEVTLLPPIPDPKKIICVGVNYRTHREETGHTEKGQPTIFTRFADTQIGHRAQAIRPTVTSRFDYEGEVALIIGKDAHRVGRGGAWDYIAGVSVYNDFTVRDWQKHSTQWIPGKNFPGTGAFGPAMVTLDELPEIDSVTLTTRVNGEVRQHAAMSDLLFDIPTLIEYITAFTPLAPGDVIVTGTPGGVGQFMDPPTFLVDGDEVEVEVGAVGVLHNTVVDQAGEPEGS
jgi:2-keto-4-pentenoate hydratase/2-oxohepta-3-ene-1,7-dioic acid hydratase in catechol pathway